MAAAAARRRSAARSAAAYSAALIGIGSASHSGIMTGNNGGNGAAAASSVSKMSSLAAQYLGEMAYRRRGIISASSASALGWRAASAASA